MREQRPNGWVNPDRVKAALRGQGREVLKTIAVLPRRVHRDQQPIAIPRGEDG